VACWLSVAEKLITCSRVKTRLRPRTLLTWAQRSIANGYVLSLEEEKRIHYYRFITFSLNRILKGREMAGSIASLSKRLKPDLLVPDT
jgi:hypothetical protein